MMNLPRHYASKSRRAFSHYFPVWAPNTPIALGDVGIIQDNCFTKVSNIDKFLKDFNIVQQKGNTIDRIMFCSDGFVNILTKITGQILPFGNTGLNEIDGGFIVEFGKKDAVLFKAENLQCKIVENYIELGSNILSLFREKKWSKDYYVVTAIQCATNTTLVTSNAKKAQITLKANTDIHNSEVKLADFNGELVAVARTGIGIEIISSNSLTPFVQLSKLDGSKKEAWDFKPKKFSDDDSETNINEGMCFRKVYPGELPV